MKPFKACKKTQPITKLKMVSYKLDGIRCLATERGFVSKTLKPIPNLHVQSLWRPEYIGFDGELGSGSPTDPKFYRNTFSAVMTIKGEPEVNWYVFDSFLNPAQPYWDRFMLTANDPTFEWGFAIPWGCHTSVVDDEGLETEAARAYALGYEGLMLRDPYGPYKFGKSTEREGYLLKVKPYEDGEARIVGFEEAMHNGNEATIDHLGHTVRSSHQGNKTPKDTLGSLQVIDLVTGIDFDIGTGFDDELRKEIWNNKEKYLGQLVKYKAMNYGKKERPRHPVFLGFRSEIDL